MGFKRVSRSAPVTDAVKPTTAPPPPPTRPATIEVVAASAAAVPAASPIEPAAKRIRLSSAAYDPACPNRYDDLVLEREQRRERVRLEAQNKKDKLEWERKESERLEKVLAAKGAAVTMSAEEAVRQRIEMSKAMGSRTAEELAAAVAAEEDAARKLANEQERKMSFAERMLRKQGWEDGQGLGRREEGITTPLAVTATSKTHGVIKQADPVKQAAAQRKKGNTKIQGMPSQVVLLRNLVKPGDVDASLRGEVAEECSKYGEVKAVRIFEETNPEIPAEERVRIFVKFERIPEAMKAVVELDGRLFAGSMISVCFYDSGKFDLSTLNVQPGEPALPAECRPTQE